MAWYHWIAVYAIIIAGILFTIIPDKSIWIWLVIIILGISGALLGLLLPHKEDKYAMKKED
ncbi:MAG: hypothetical protein ABF649_00810 [Bacillus sp. (in: firmicutes)]